MHPRPDHDHGGSAIKHHVKPDDIPGPIDYIERDPCTDDDCARPHVYVLTVDQLCTIIDVTRKNANIGYDRHTYAAIIDAGLRGDNSGTLPAVAGLLVALGSAGLWLARRRL